MVALSSHYICGPSLYIPSSTNNLLLVLLTQDSYKNCTYPLQQEIRGAWPDLLITVLCDEWKKCKRGIYCKFDVLTVLSWYVNILMMCLHNEIFYL
jgi:hypothetical protein